jgi:hypothetical protein
MGASRRSISKHNCQWFVVISLFSPDSDFYQHPTTKPLCLNLGDLGIEVDQVCTDKIASVSLELQLDEFSEVKYLWVAISMIYNMSHCFISAHRKEGVTLPTPNCLRMFGAFGYPNHDKYYELLHDPALWLAKAKERTASKSAVTLIKKLLSISFLVLPIIMALNFYAYSQPVIVPFTVAVPNANYPLAFNLLGYLFSDSGRETHSVHLYCYTTLIALMSGHKVEIPTGYTTFDPVHDISLSMKAFSTNVMFEEPTWGLQDHFQECTADKKPIWGAQVTLEGGNVV